MNWLARAANAFALFRKAAPATTTVTTTAPIYGGTWARIFDWMPGGWQMDALDPIARDAVVAYGPVFSAVTLIAGDVAKMRPRLMERSAVGIWSEVVDGDVTVATALNVLDRPNDYQNWQQFAASWMMSKLLSGNTYALKSRDDAGRVKALYILDPLRVLPLVTPGGSIYYQLQPDYLTGLEEGITVPSEEIVHDRWNTLFHPLIGMSPIFACALSATQGLGIQKHGAAFFKNMGRPSGLLTAPGTIATETAERLKAKWDENYSRENAGKIAVLGDGLKYEPMTMSATDSQLIEQLNWTAKDVAGAFHVPPFKLGEPLPHGITNVESLIQIYFTDCLQTLIEALERCMDDGLELKKQRLGVELCTDDLLRMTTEARFRAWGAGIQAGFLSPNEARRREDLPPVEGGDSCYLQQQNFSLAALAKRDASIDPFASAGGGAGSGPPNQPPPAAGDQAAAKFLELLEQRVLPEIAGLKAAAAAAPLRIPLAPVPPRADMSANLQERAEINMPSLSELLQLPFGEAHAKLHEAYLKCLDDLNANWRGAELSDFYAQCEKLYSGYLIDNENLWKAAGARTPEEIASMEMGRLRKVAKYQELCRSKLELTQAKQQ